MTGRLPFQGDYDHLWKNILYENCDFNLPELDQFSFWGKDLLK